ncbi:MAG: glycosyltransferase [Planctomycetales bacterium]|nr:glycosyltransferase [Planctomycetales bacterium]
METCKSILITNLVLDRGTGTEMYTYDLVLALERKNYRPVIYCPRPGKLALRMRQEGICVVQDIQHLNSSPDVIQGHHTVETLAAAARFPQSPVVFVCHDCSQWHDTPPRLPNILRYVAVDQACYDRLVFQHGVPAQLVELIPNGVDLERFPLRKQVAPQPRSVLLFGNSFKKRHLRIVQSTFPGLQASCIGLFSRRWVSQPAQLLPQFDVVIARGRSAREALATGASVIVGDPTGIGGLVTPENYEWYAANNFGRRLLRQPFSPTVLAEALSGYSTDQINVVTRLHRVRNGLESSVDLLCQVYDQVMQQQFRIESRDWHLSVSEWLQWCSLTANIPAENSGLSFSRNPVQYLTQRMRKGWVRRHRAA